jgi:hypothetical protein
VNKSSEKGLLEIFFVSVGALIFITAAAREKISGQWWYYYTWLVACRSNYRYDVFNCFFEDFGGSNNCPTSEMKFSITFKWKGTCPVELFESHRAVAEQIEHERYRIGSFSLD